MYLLIPGVPLESLTVYQTTQHADLQESLSRYFSQQVLDTDVGWEVWRCTIIPSNIFPFFQLSVNGTCSDTRISCTGFLFCFPVDYQQNSLAKVSGRAWAPQLLLVAIINKPKRRSASLWRRKQILSRFVWLSKYLYTSELLGRNSINNYIFSLFLWSGWDCFLSNMLSEITCSFINFYEFLLASLNYHWMSLLYITNHNPTGLCPA